MIDINCRAEQQAHRLHMPVMAGGNQSRAAVAVGAFQVGASGQGGAQDFDVAARAGQQIGTVLLIVLGVHVGAARHQPARRLDMVAVGGGQQRAASAHITLLDRRTGLDQHTHAGQVATARGLDQFGPPARLRLQEPGQGQDRAGNNE